MIRLYGMTIGNGSYARVTHGVRRALERLGLVDGFVPMDNLDSWGDYEGAMADVGVFVGPQRSGLAAMMSNRGLHKRRLMLLPLNSSYCPEEILDFTSKPVGRPLVTGWLTPSRWSALQLRRLTEAPVTVWRHGVSDEFNLGDERAKLVESFGDGEFNVLHLASTVRQRKGTEALVRAWVQARFKGLLPKRANLTLVLSGGEVCLPGLLRDAGDSVKLIEERLDLDNAATASLLRTMHAVAQPSRGEGFGMVPLEALCCGVPVLATTCSGHSEYLSPSTPGVAAVEAGPNTRIDDGPDAVAPSVAAEAIERALVALRQDWRRFFGEAGANAEAMRRQWSWDVVMKIWAEQEGWLR